jgi:hypothetical protein
LTPPPAQRKTIDFALIGAGRRIIESALSVVPGERVVIVFDEAREAVASPLVDAAELVQARPQAFVLEQLGTRPITRVPDVLREALAEAQASVLLIGIDDPLEQPFRREFVHLVDTLKLRHAHLVGVTRKALVGGFNVEPSRIVDMTRQVRTRLIGKSELHYTTSYGTDLTVTLPPDARWGEQVGIIRPGRWENLPAGHIFVHPANVKGTYVANASIDIAVPNHTTSLLTSPPVRFEIEGGQCKSVTCGDTELAAHIARHLKSVENLDRIGQIVLGTNPGLASPIGEVVYDACVPGMHLVFGWSNPKSTGAPWVAQGILVANGAGGDLDVDGQAVMRAGRYLV